MKKAAVPLIFTGAILLGVAVLAEAQQRKSAPGAGAMRAGSASIFFGSGGAREPGRSLHIARKVAVPKARRQHAFPRLIHRVGFSGVGGASEPQVIIIEQAQAGPAAESREPTAHKVYVQPRWVDGGHGVEVLQPGYWTDPKHAPR